MRKGNMTILASILAITLVAMAAGAGTMAYFSDTETSSGNVLTAGTLQIKVDRNPISDQFDWVDGIYVPTLNSVTGFNDVVNKLKPGQTEDVMVGIKNFGNMAGYPNYEITNVEDIDAHGLTSEISVEIWYGYGVTGSYTETYVGTWTLADLDDSPIYSTYELAPLEDAYWRMNLHFDADAPNDVQGDAVSFDVEFGIHQVQGSK